jgi:hypothetical protein
MKAEENPFILTLDPTGFQNLSGLSRPDLSGFQNLTGLNMDLPRRSGLEGFVIVPHQTTQLCS